MNAVVEKKELSPLAFAREQFDSMGPQFANALPAHIPVERFMRVVMTAVGSNPDLIAADRASLFESSMKAAQDGLLPDGRDGALVIYNTKAKDGGWLKKVQWMPMIAGVMKKARNSGEISSIEAHVVHANDRFQYRVGIDDAPQHEPDWFGERGAPIGVYAVAKLKDGTRMSEIMSVRDVEQIRAVSGSKDKGPWAEWWGEMARKSVLRRLAKRLPMSSDLDDLIRRDDALYDMDGASDKVAQPPRPKGLLATMDALAASGHAAANRALPPHDAITGELTDASGTAAPTRDATEGGEAGRPLPASPSDPRDDGGFPGDTLAQTGGNAATATPAAANQSAREWGRENAMNGVPRTGVPRELNAEGRADDLAAYLAGFDEATAEAEGGHNETR